MSKPSNNSIIDSVLKQMLDAGGLTGKEVETIIEVQGILNKYFDVMIAGVRYKFANFDYIGKEGEAYATVSIIEQIKKDISNTQKAYKEFKTGLNKE